MMWMQVTAGIWLTAPVYSILQDLIDTLLALACKMEHSGVQDTDRVIDSVIHSINCSCADRPVSNGTTHA